MASLRVNVQELIKDKLFRLTPDVLPAIPKKRAVVFIHGFRGTAQDTWTARGTDDSFPVLLATDLRLQDHECFLFQYVTRSMNPPAIDNIVIQLKFAINAHIPHSRVILVCHSMGGLVAMRFVLALLEEGHLRSICGLLLYGVPMTGVEWTKYAQLALGIGEFKFPLLRWLGNYLKTNKQVQALHAGGQFIDELSGKWVLRVLNGGYPRVSAEQRAWVPVRVVTGNDDWVVRESSARGFYSEIDWIDADQDHRALVKPSDRSELTYQIAFDFLKECREWMSPPSLLKLRRQIDGIWNLHRLTHIVNWRFDLKFEEARTRVGSDFGISGFNRFRVLECSYARRISNKYLKFGFANGHISAGALWSDDFIFLHCIRFGALGSAGMKIQEQLRDIVSQHEQGWRRLFDNVRISLRRPDTDVWYRLAEGAFENVSDGLVRRFVLPAEAEDLLGETAVVDIAFDGLLPAEISDYTVEFPWLCDGFAVTVTVEGRPVYLIATLGLRGNSKVETKREAQGKIECSSEDVALPNSRIQFEWHFERQEQQ